MNRKYYIAFSLFLTSAVFTHFYVPEFKPDSCIKDHTDGYIWYIADYSWFSYTVLGWQEYAWGNPANIGKGILERYATEEGIPRYHEIQCPEFELN